MRRRYLRYLAIWAAWSIPPIFLTVAAMVERRRPMGTMIVLQFVPWYYWALLTLPIAHFALKHPAATLRTPRGALRHLGAAMLAGVGCAILSSVARLLVHLPGAEPASFMKLLHYAIPFWCIFGLMFYGLIAAFAFVRERELATAQLQKSLVEAQLNGLRMQLQPHFLFNTLNTAAMYVRDGDAGTSIRVLTRLSELLRRVLDTGAAQEVPLTLELEHAERYLEIEALRFSDRLDVRVDVPDELRNALFPNLALQPVIENAIRHGIAQTGARSALDITAQRVGDELHVRVFNTGPQLEGKGRSGRFERDSSGIGLSNTRLRLEHLYGERGRLLLQDADGGVSCEIVVPYHV